MREVLVGAWLDNVGFLSVRVGRVALCLPKLVVEIPARGARSRATSARSASLIQKLRHPDANRLAAGASPAHGKPFLSIEPVYAVDP